MGLNKLVYKLLPVFLCSWLCLASTPSAPDLKVSTQVFHDENGRMRLGDILAMPSRNFRPLSDEPNFGFSNGSAWLKVELTVRTDEVRYLVFEKGTLGRVELYWPEGAVFTQHMSGSSIAPGMRALAERRPTFKLNLPKGTTTVLVRVTSPYYLDVGFNIIDDAKYRIEPRENSFYGLTYGLLIAMTLFSALFLVTSHMTAYRGYFYFGLTILLYLAINHGNMDLFFPLPFSFCWSDLCNSVSGLAALAIFQYERQLLSSHRTMRRLDNALRIGLLGVVFGTLTPIHQLRALAGPIGDLSFIGSSILSLVMGFLGIKKRIPGMVHFMLGYGFVAISFVYYQLALYHVTPHGALLDIVFELGVSCQMITMSLGLSHSLLRSQKEKLQAKQEAMLHAERADNAKVVLQVLAHDLSNPLAVIIGAADLMQKRLDKDSNDLKMWEMVSRAALVEQEIINSTKRLFEIDTLQRNPRSVSINPGEILEQILFIFHDKLLAKNIKLTSNLDKSAVEFASEKTVLFNNVINNIIANAIKFTGSGGTIDFQIKEAGSDVVFIISDSGMGMPAHISENINKGFSDTSTIKRLGTNAESGTGFGLTIARKTLHVLGGKISVKSWEATEENSSHGTEVTLVLPKVFLSTS